MFSQKTQEDLLFLVTDKLNKLEDEYEAEHRRRVSVVPGAKESTSLKGFTLRKLASLEVMVETLIEAVE